MRNYHKFGEWRVTQLEQRKVYCFYYLTYINNLDSILKFGIWPKNILDSRGVQYSSFAEDTVQDRRHSRKVYLSGKRAVDSIHDLVPLYFIPHTPTLYARKDHQDDFAIIKVKSYLLKDERVELAFTDGNAASLDTHFHHDLKLLDNIDWRIIRSKYWSEYDDGTRKRNAELLIHPLVPPQYIWSIGVSSPQSLERINGISKGKYCTEVRKDWFF